MKIYDCFLFFNELELLEIRLEMLYTHVDYFIISECDSTFSGLDKPFYFDENKDKFTKYLDKIIHIKHFNSKDYSSFTNPYVHRKGEIYDDITNKFKNDSFAGKNESHWCLEFLHREYVKLGMDICNDEDLILFSDTDEIPNPNVFEKFKQIDLEQNYVLLQDSCCYYLNVISHTNWFGTYVTKYKNVKNSSVNNLRTERVNYHIIENSGWHFSFVGGKDKIVTKIKSWGHQELNQDWIVNQVGDNLENLRDLFGRNNRTYRNEKQEFFYEKMKIKNIHDMIPLEIVSLVQNKYPFLIKEI
jgi:beta-1,4-mannosyl-glycoprotein beta-1,4-N-acetylglucosaminyltransferase